MTIIQHYKETRKEYGILISFLSIIPDVASLLWKIIPQKDIRNLFLILHNTERAVDRMKRLNRILGIAWRKHREQDLKTHLFKYEDPVSRYMKKKIPDDSVMLFSGGLDSFIVWRLLGQPRAIYFVLNHKAQEQELKRVNLIMKMFGGTIKLETSLQWLWKHEQDNGYIPYRNLLFLIIASYYSDNVIMSQILEHAPDKNKTFYRSTESLLKRITTGSFQNLRQKRLKIIAPYSKYTKTDLVKKYTELYDGKDLLKYTYSCYSGKDVHCGKCTACVSRWIAMKNNNIDEKYETDPQISSYSNKWSLKDFRLDCMWMYIKRWQEIKRSQ